MPSRPTPAHFSCGCANTGLITEQTAYFKFPCARCSLKKTSGAKAKIQDHYNEQLKRISSTITNCNRCRDAPLAQQRQLAYLNSNFDGAKAQRDAKLLSYSNAVKDIEGISWTYQIYIDDKKDRIKKAEDHLWKYDNPEMEKMMKKYQKEVERLGKERDDKIEGVVQAMEAAW